jgi:internalin A
VPNASSGGADSQGTGGVPGKAANGGTTGSSSGGITGATGSGAMTTVGATACTDPLTLADPYVESWVRAAIDLPNGPILPTKVAGLTDLFMIEPAGTPVDPPPGYVGPVTSLAGVECLSNLRTLYFEAYFVDLAPLARLPNLQVLTLLEAWETNVPRLPQVTEFRGDLHSNTAAVLSALPSLKGLNLIRSDLSTAEARAALSRLTGLTKLLLPGAGLTDTAPLAPLRLLTVVDLSSNQIRDLSSLSSLVGLQTLDLTGNQITDLSPLVANIALFDEPTIALGANPIDCAAQARNIETLRSSGVSLTVDCP